MPHNIIIITLTGENDKLQQFQDEYLDISPRKGHYIGMLFVDNELSFPVTTMSTLEDDMSLTVEMDDAGEMRDEITLAAYVVKRHLENAGRHHCLAVNLDGSIFPHKNRDTLGFPPRLATR